MQNVNNIFNNGIQNGRGFGWWGWSMHRRLDKKVMIL